MQFELNGRLKKGRFLSFRSNLILARNLILFADGSFAFAGNTKKVNSFSFTSYAMFLYRTNPFTSVSDYSCISMSNIPDDDAFGYNENMGDFINALDVKNPNMKLFSTRMLNF